MGFLKKYKTTFLIIAIVVIGGIAYNILFKEENNKNLLTSDLDLSGSDSVVSMVENDLLTLLLDIRSVKLDDSIFSEETFKSLEDFGQDIAPEPAGRENPFAPIGFIASPNGAEIIDGGIE